MATTDDEGRVGFWNGRDGKVHMRKCGGESLRAAGWWNDCLLVASASRLFAWRNQRLERSVRLSNEGARARRVMWLVPLEHERILVGDSMGQVSVLVKFHVLPPTTLGSSCLSAACASGLDEAFVVSTAGTAFRVHIEGEGTCTLKETIVVDRSMLSAVASFPWFQVCAGDDGRRGWLLRPSKLDPEEVFLGHAAAVVCLQARKASELLSLSNDQTVRVFSVAEKGLAVLRKLETCISQPSALCFSFKQNRLVVAGAQGFDELWDESNHSH